MNLKGNIPSNLTTDQQIFEAGLALYSKRQYFECLEYFDALSDPEFEILKYYHLGLTLIQLGQFEEGLANYRKINSIPNQIQGIEYDKMMYSLYINMGSTLQVLSRRKKNQELNLEAINCYTYALQIKEHDARVWNNLGNAQLDNNQYQEAIKSFKKAIELDDEFPEAHYSLSLVYESLRLYENAVSELKQGLKWKANNKIYLNRIAGLLFGLGNMEEAKEYAEKVLQLNPEDPTASKNMALILYNIGDYLESYKYYSKLLDIQPDFSEPEVNGVFTDLLKKINK